VAAPERAEKVLTLTFSAAAFALIEGHPRLFTAPQSAAILSPNHALPCISRMSFNAKQAPPAYHPRPITAVVCSLGVRPSRKNPSDLCSTRLRCRESVIERTHYRAESVAFPGIRGNRSRPCYIDWNNRLVLPVMGLQDVVGRMGLARYVYATHLLVSGSSAQVPLGPAVFLAHVLRPRRSSPLSLHPFIANLSSPAVLVRDDCNR